MCAKTEKMWCDFMIVHASSNEFCIQFSVFGLDSGLGLFPPGMDPGKLYSPLMEMPDPRAPPHDPHMFSSVKKKCKEIIIANN